MLERKDQSEGKKSEGSEQKKPPQETKEAPNCRDKVRVEAKSTRASSPAATDSQVDIDRGEGY